MYYCILVYLIHHVCIVMSFICYLALKQQGFAVENEDLGIIVYVQV